MRWDRGCFQWLICPSFPEGVGLGDAAQRYGAKQTYLQGRWDDFVKLNEEAWFGHASHLVRYVLYAPCFQTFNLDIFRIYLLDVGTLLNDLSLSPPLIGSNCAQKHLNLNSLCFSLVHSNSPHTPAFQMRFISFIVLHCPAFLHLRCHFMILS